MKPHSLKMAILIAAAAYTHIPVDRYIELNPYAASFNPGGKINRNPNSGVRSAQRAAKSRRNLRARSAK